MATEPLQCFHCAEPVSASTPIVARIDGIDRPMCCPGCKAVAEFIVDAGLSNFYGAREVPSRQVLSDDDRQAQWIAYDNQAVQRRVTHELATGDREAVFLVEGIRCAACTWLIERSTAGLAGIKHCEANPATSRVLFSWDPDRIRLSEILQQIARLGFVPHPVSDRGRSDRSRDEQRAAMRRLVVAGIGMMQVLMFSVGLYTGAFESADVGTRDFLRLISLIVATPVVVYSGFPFFSGAFRDLRHGRPGMDVPVALAVGAAYLASLWVTLRGGTEVYFDSATMFVFLLSAARYLEMKARHRAGDTADALQDLLPQFANVLSDNGEHAVPVEELAVGDRVIVRPGDIVPADGRVCWGRSSVDQSIMTGEFGPRAVGIGSHLIAGSQNLGQGIQIDIEKTGNDTAISAISHLIERAQASKPSISRLADQVARWFVAALLVLAVGVAAYWVQVDPSRAFTITLALLVVTCPCALSLAMPTAFTAVIDRLARNGILVTNSDSLENLTTVRSMLLDKTGTLTEGKYEVLETHAASGHSSQSVQQLAARLEQASEHPIAHAFRRWSDGQVCDQQVFHAGEGVEGIIDGCRYRLGTPIFASGLISNTHPGVIQPMPEAESRLTVMLAGEGGWIGSFVLGDRLRDDAVDAIDRLESTGIDLEIASGANLQEVSTIAEKLGIVQVQAGLRPKDKLKLLRRRQRDACRVAMIGDGINDAPVLAAADVSFAMGGGAALAHASADVIVLADRLGAIPDTIDASRKTLRVVKQNLSWAVAYNLVAVPLAAAGLVHPWMAAIGMSLSSLLVVANSSRLAHGAKRAVALVGTRT